MATTSGTMAAGKLPVGQRGGKRNAGRAAGLVAIAALGLSLVVGGLAIQGRQAAPAERAASANPFAGDTHVYTPWDFREDRRAETHDLFIVDQFTYREDRRVEIVPTLVPSDYLPDGWTYREDHRVGATAPAAQQAAGAVERPVDSATSPEFRWDYGAGYWVLRPQDASVSDEYRWDFDERRSIPAGGPADEYLR
jgi:hypothetical protein